MEIDRRAFIASLGGTAAVSLMDSEAKADSLEHWMEEQLDEQVAADQGHRRSSRPSPRSKRRSKRATIDAAPAACSCPGAATSRSSSRCRRIRRFRISSASASRPPITCCRARPARLKTGMSEEIVLACLLHDCVLNLIKAGSRLVGRAALRALHPGEVDVRDSLPPDAALLSRRRRRLRISRTSTTGSSARTTNRQPTSRRPTRCSRTTSGTWSRAS